MTSAPIPDVQADEIVQRQRFNDDLLAAPADQELARERFPQVFHVLDFPALREKFAFYDGIANRNRRLVRRVGLLAVLLAAIALLSSALMPLFPHAPTWVLYIQTAIEILGLIGGVVLAIGGFILFRRKSTWLRARLMTERLRQFHFQVIVRRWPEVIASCREGGAQEYEGRRLQWLNEFLNQYEGRLAGRLTAATAEPGAEECWLVQESTESAPDPSADPVAAELFQAYRELRIEHQHLYCQYKLQTDTNASVLKFFDWPLGRQEEVLRFLSSVFILVALVTSLCTIVGQLFDIEPLKHYGWSAASIITFILGAGIRAVEEGLAIGPELERYMDYGARMRDLLRRFTATGDEKVRRELMKEMEEESFEEMRGFLRTTKKARYIF